MSIYKIDHFYSADHDKYCLLIKSDIELEKLIKILGVIQFKFEALIDHSVCVWDEHMLEILKEFYNVEDIKNQYKSFLPHTNLDKYEWEIFNEFYFEDKNVKIIQIDLYEARESCCGNEYKSLMDEYLPKDEQLEVLEEKINSFKELYENDF